MCMIPVSFIRILCQSNNRRNWCLLILFLFLIFYSLVIWHQLEYPYVPYSSARDSYDFERNESHRIYLTAEEIGNTYVDVHNVSHANAADFKCIVTRTVPSTTVCLFSQFRDMYISHDLEETGKWESHVADEFLETLRRHPAAGVIDIGANIGYYTMLAASSGHKVIAVEPNLDCIDRLHRAAQIENVAHRITVLHNAVADVRTNATIRTTGDNQGDTRIHLEVKECTGACPPTVRTIVLNDIGPVVTFTHAIVKMDMQGYEHRAFQHAEKLFNRVVITHIFMEWMLMRDHVNTNGNTNRNANINSKDLANSDDNNQGMSEGNNTSNTQLPFVKNMLRFLFERNYRPYALNTAGGQALDSSEWNRWPDDIIWHLKLGPETHAKLVRNHFADWPQ